MRKSGNTRKDNYRTSLIATIVVIVLLPISIFLTCMSLGCFSLSHEETRLMHIPLSSGFSFHAERGSIRKSPSLSQEKEDLYKRNQGRSIHIEDAMAELARIREESNHPSEVVIENYVEGPSLTASRGTIQGPSGKETYYNLDMSGVVNHMRNNGFGEDAYPYWIRYDGAKMLGDYVILAADLNTRPKGTILETSMGLGIVCDTGEFAKTNPTQIDIATNW